MIITAKINKIIFLIFINNFLLLYFFKPSIFTFINTISVLIMVAVAAVAAAAFAATAVYVVVVARVRTGFLILFIAFFISWSYPFTLLLYFFLSYLISLIIVSN